MRARTPLIEADLLPQLRERAARLDPVDAATYAAMPLERWREGAEVSALLLLEHAVHLLHRHAGNGDVHRHAHDQAISALLQTASQMELVAGLSVLVVASQHLGHEPGSGA